MERTFNEQSDQGNKRYMGMQESDTGLVGSKTTSGGWLYSATVTGLYLQLLFGGLLLRRTEIKEAERLASRVKSWG